MLFNKIDLNIFFQNYKMNSIKDNNLKKLLKAIFSKNIFWEEYSDNFFFKENKENEEEKIFNIKCNRHSENFIYYCINCKRIYVIYILMSINTIIVNNSIFRNWIY